MALESITLRGFRNLAPLSIRFGVGSNYVFGPNGAGKTNLLEAIHYLAIGRSFRRCPEGELLGFGAEVLSVAGAEANGRSGEIRFDGKEKRVMLDGVRVERLSDYLGWLPVVVLLLEDIELVRGAPGLRRWFMDMAVAKADRKYVGLSSEYRKAVMQYNRLLEGIGRYQRPETRIQNSEGRAGSGGDEIEVWEEEMVRTGVPVYEHRLKLAEGLLSGAERHFALLAGEPIEFSYHSTIGSGTDLAGPFRERLVATRQRAAFYKHALVGPHRDDIKIVRAGRDLRRFGSVGEQRLAGIALRLAEADMLAGASGARPVFLLDEVASELDEKRSRTVLELVGERGQMIYAAARPIEGSRGQGVKGSSDSEPAVLRDGPQLEPSNPRSLEPSPRKEFHVEAGAVSEVS